MRFSAKAVKPVLYRRPEAPRAFNHSYTHSYIPEEKTFQSLLLGLTFGNGQLILCSASGTSFVHVDQLEEDVLCQIAGGAV